MGGPKRVGSERNKGNVKRKPRHFVIEKGLNGGIQEKVVGARNTRYRRQ